MILISLISVAFLFLILYSDSKTRQIPITYLLAETILSLCLGFMQISISLFRSTITNLMIIGIQIFVLWFWLKTKNAPLRKNLWSSFGKGDLFMLGILAINFSALNYLFFTIFLSIISILIWLGTSTIWKNMDQTIPFAGFLAAGLLVFRILRILGIGVNYYSDDFILNLCYGIY